MMKRISSLRRLAPTAPSAPSAPHIEQLKKEQDANININGGLNPTKTESAKFSFERLVASFQKMSFAKPSNKVNEEGALPNNCTCFLKAIDEIILLFDELGAAFGFVAHEIQRKADLLKSYSAQSPRRYVSLENAVSEEVRDGTADRKPPPSGSRTLLRLMWALKFIDCLLKNLHTNHGTLKQAVTVAYNSALAEHHAWPLRTSVKAAINVLPSKEHFVNRIGATKTLVEKLSAILSPMVTAMYKYYEKRKLLDLQ